MGEPLRKNRTPYTFFMNISTGEANAVPERSRVHHSVVQSHENQSIYECHPPRGLSEARQGRDCLENFQSLIRRGGVPSGAAAFITWNIEILIRHHI